VRIVLIIFSSIGLISGIALLKEKINSFPLIFICAIGTIVGFYNIYVICKTDKEIEELKKNNDG